METLQEPYVHTNHVHASTTKQPVLLAYSIGYALLTLSFSLYILFTVLKLDQGNTFTSFIVHYMLALFYAVILVLDGAYGIRKSWRKANIHKTVILLNLFLISAYSLNRDFVVFQDSTDWLCVYLVVTSLITLSYRFYEKLPAWLNSLQHVVLGSAMVLYLYLTLYVANLYAIGTIGILLFGIGMHIYVPVFLLIGCSFLLVHTGGKKRSRYYPVIVGALATIAYTASFAIEWTNRTAKIDRIANQSVMYNQVELPAWVTIAQSVKNDWITERILKSDLVYTTPRLLGDWDFMPNTTSWSETKKHDPLVFIACRFAKIALSNEDRVKILQALFDGRHQAQERFWSGDNLSTSYIVSDVDIYTDLRIAYTEKYFNVRNNASPQRWWGDTEEAIYTFQLPEGSVVTSLSLWINGKEEKGILTSKQKATEAYQTIVGVESRDPSVVHWQEGNTVSVRVFPCNRDEERKFKIGVTSPLIETNGKVHYTSLTFRGPNASDATETTRVRFIGLQEGIALPESFTVDKNGDYISEHAYDPDFSFSFKARPLPENHFTFNGYTYSLAKHQPRLELVALNTLYLDINKTWSQEEIEALSKITGRCKVYAYTGQEMVQLTDANWETVTNALREQNFSLFPFHLVKNYKTSVVVTKGEELSLHLKDFKESRFAESIRSFFISGKKVRVFNLGKQTSTYVNTLRELRGLAFADGTVTDLLDHLADQTFPLTEESEENIVLHAADMTITKVMEVKQIENNAPDHLARLYAYNNIMRRVGTHYFHDDYVNKSLVDEAATAYVVSPVSSLIVLETQNDYDRFGITQQDNSLLNASKNSQGAVPEPHEWALIVLFLLFVLYTRQSKLSWTR
jgi:XrtN system VIT domain protein